jgi:hypothetical protein
MKPGIYRPKLSVDGNFTTIPNHWIRNTGLSVNANFLLVYLLTHEVGYNITFAQIEREISLGETAIRKAVNQLRDAGWLETQRTTDKRGYNAGLAWILTEPNLANPTLANPALEKRGAIENNLIKKTTNKENNNAFDSFWSVYPRKIAKGAAEKAWVKLNPDADLVATILAAMDSFDWPSDEKFIPYPATWINARRWEDEKPANDEWVATF